MDGPFGDVSAVPISRHGVGLKGLAFSSIPTTQARDCKERAASQNARERQGLSW
ncbi:hypothetical protein [Natronococcus roseus]|uniref:hypothetical protein n=1 Tax=Natronococcus roseus TaxID=1052014 RepID=UPI00374DA015